MTTKKLTDKQEMFCKEYLVDLNATQAAIRAGYSSHTAQEIGSENLSKPILAQRIQALMAKRSDKVGITSEYVLNGIKETTEQARDEDKLTESFKGYELLGRHLKLFTDKVDHSFDPNAPLTLNITKTVRSARDTD